MTVKLIQVITDFSIEKIAKSVDYSREYLTKAMNSDVGNAAIEKALLEVYKDEIADFFDENLPIFQEDSPKYALTRKIVDSESELVHGNIQIKGMLRVIIRNQAFIISQQTGEDLEIVLLRIEEAIKDELKEDFEDGQ